MGPSNGKYKSMYSDESEMGAGNSHKLLRKAKVSLFWLFLCCPQVFVEEYNVQGIFVLPRQLDCHLCNTIDIFKVFWVGNYKYLFFSNSVFLHLNNTTFITTLWNYVW
jgi:hypothetical protein